MFEIVNIAFVVEGTSQRKRALKKLLHTRKPLFHTSGSMSAMVLGLVDTYSPKAVVRAVPGSKCFMFRELVIMIVNRDETPKYRLPWGCAEQ